MHKVILKKKIDEFIETLPNSELIRSKLKELRFFKIIKLPPDIGRIKGKQKNRYRLRVGKVRFVFDVFGKMILIKAGDYRGKVYK
jgi:mRNA-degrading endonuclease RelE of RelBE toxin-antitoxin system